MLKILYVIGSMQVGGAERHLYRIASELAKSDYQIQIFALDPEGPLKQLFEENGIRVRGVRFPAWIKKFMKTNRILAWISLVISSLYLFLTLLTYRPKVAHFFLPAAYIIGGSISLLFPNIKRVMSRRSMNYYQDKHTRFAKIERWLHPKMDVITGNSQAVIEQLQEEGVAKSNLRLIYNGINTNEFKAVKTRSHMRQELGCDENTLIFTMVANLIAYKGHSDLIDAFHCIKDKMPKDWLVLLAGRDDGIQADLYNQALALGIEKHFHFLGSRKDIPDLLHASDVGILCSHEEGFSNAVLEGMVSGLPMVVTDVGGNAEAVIDGEVGLVVPAKQPEQLATALLVMIDNNARTEIGQKAKNRVETTFSMQACLDEYENMYSQLLEHSGKRSVPIRDRL
ncbi:glycosyltransferase [Legionella shakespearei]|uniref:CapM protein, capsular polysaccharide biosynthesis n=1 Tax=Legionella shakespearei DSM 23087 TaxID=1122169 RepID=A0A0W0YVP4_9GAMM|nr:glycosyltransferase [Legionella shakespearei]KTD60718.1 CapM protein, capsular polysaccharide biosynthesis [Legionella shakespearei DSM 23087]